MKKIKLLILFFISFTSYMFSQTYLMQNGSFTTCSGTFYDSGGASGNYADLESYTLTFVPSTPGMGIRLAFSFIDIESGYEHLNIYDGDSTTANELYNSNSGSANPTVTATSTNTTGALTIKFTSDPSTNMAGWSAAISCVNPVVVNGIPMQNGSFTTCSNTLYDSGGVSGNYNNNENYTLTLCPATAGQAVLLDFISFNTMTGDILTIYDGNSTSANVIYTLSGTVTPPGQIGATTNNPTGCLTLVFNSTVNDVASGWRANITCGTPLPFVENYNMSNTNVTTCSGNFYDSGGQNANYAASEAYTMTFCPATPGQAIQFNFTSFVSEATYDVITFYDGNSTAAQILGTFSGTASLPVITATTSNPTGCITVKFTSDGSVNNPGWHAYISCVPPLVTTGINMYTGNETTCSNVLFDSGGMFGSYANNQNLTLTLCPSTAGQAVLLDFTSVDIASGDALYIYDGNSVSASLLYVISGTSLPPQIGATENNPTGCLTLKFTSNASGVAGGWRADISCGTPLPYTPIFFMDTTAVTTCTGTFLDSGGFVGDYANNLNITKTFCPSTPGQAVLIDFSSLNIAAGDALYVYDGNSASAPLVNMITGTTNPGQIGASVNNTSGCLTLKFVSNSSTTAAGWVASISCGAALPFNPLYIMTNNTTVTTCSGTFYDSGGSTGTYNSSENMTMTFCPGTPGQGIVLNFSMLNVENTYDFISFYDGANTSAPLIATITGADIIPIISASIANTSGCITVKFTSDSSMNNAGWVAAISCQVPQPNNDIIMHNGSVTTCDRVLYDSGGQYGLYSNNENYTLTICPETAGLGVFLDFTTFNIDTGDTLYVYDGPTATSPLLGALTGTGILPQLGATTDNTSGCLTLKFVSNASVNRAGWRANVYCAEKVTLDQVLMTTGTVTKCGGLFLDAGGAWGNYPSSQNQTLTFYPVNPTENVQLNFTQFILESNGDFMYIYDGPDTTAPLMGIFTGTVSPGIIGASYFNASGALTVRFVSDGSANNIGWSAIISCYVPVAPPTDDPLNCSVLEASADSSVGCQGGPCKTITADIELQLVAGGSDTTSYTVGTMECSLSALPGTPTGLVIDDRWSAAIPLGFNFSFFGNTYSQVLIGANGVLTFDLADANGFCPWSFSASVPSPSLITNAIFGAYHDIDPSIGGTIGYYSVGTAPYRMFVVNFNQIPHFSSTCHSLLTTQQIVLYETTNIIEVYVRNKPVCSTWNGGRALIGIQNASGTVGYTPTGRNTGAWAINNEFYRFLPNSTLPVAYTFNWLDQNNNIISNDFSTEVCPTQTTTYTAQLNYTLFGTNFTVEEPVTITYNGTASVTATQPEDLNNCLVNGIAYFDLTRVIPQVVNGQTGVTVSFYYNEQDAYNMVNPVTSDVTNFPVNTDYQVWVRVDNDNDNCFAITQFFLRITPNGQLIVNEPLDLSACDTTPGQTGNALFNLNSQNALVTGGNSSLSASYYLTEANATSGTNPLTSPYQNISNPQTIYVRVQTASGCYDTDSFLLQVGQSTFTPLVTSQTVCNNGAGQGIFDLQSIVNENPSYQVRVYAIQADAQAGNTNFITNLSTYTSSAGTVYVRLTDSNNCFTVTAYQLNITTPTFAPVVTSQSVCNDGTNNGVFNLQTIVSENSSYQVSVYATQADAQAGNSNFITNLSSYTSTTATVYVRLVDTNNCFTVTAYQLNVYAPIPQAAVTLQNACNNGSSQGVFNLQSIVTDNTGYTVSIYASYADAQAGTNALAITNAYTSSTGDLYVRLADANGCYSVTTYHLNVYAPVPQAAVTSQNACNNGSGQGVFDLQSIVSDNTAYTVSVYLSNADAQAGINSISLTNAYTSNASTVYVRLLDANGCYSVTPYLLNVYAQVPSATVTSQTVCNNGSGQGIFDLQSIINDNPSYQVSIYNTYADAQSGTNALAISNAYTSSSGTVFVKLTDTHSCFSITEYHLNLYAPIPQAAVTSQSVCNNGSGQGVFDLQSIVNDNTAYTVSIYASYADAQAGTNALAITNAYTSSTGDIYVRLADANGCYSVTTYHLNVYAPIPQAAVTSQSVCNNGSGQGVFNLQNIVSDNPAYQVSVYPTQADAQSATNAISITSNYTVAAGTIYVRLATSNGCFSVTSYSLNLYAPLTIPTVNAQSICSDASSSTGTFNLQSIVSASPSYTVSVYTSPADANAGNSNYITNLSSFTSANATLYVRLYNSSTGCSAVYNYSLHVNARPTAQKPADLEACNQGSGYAIFDLTELIDDIEGTQTGVSTTFYTTQSDAEAGINSIQNISTFNTIARDVFVRVLNPSNCYNITNFKVKVNNCVPEIPNVFSPDGDGTNDLFMVGQLRNVFDKFVFRVYNRWGNEVYTIDHNTAKVDGHTSKLILWDGKINGLLNNTAEAETFFYILELNDGIHEPLKGWIYVNP